MRLLAILVLVTTAGLASADNHEILVGWQDRSMRAPSADAVTGDNLGGAQIGYAHVLPVATIPGLELWLGGGMELGGAQGEMFQTLTTELSTVAFVATARARYWLSRPVFATARLSLGAVNTSLSLTDEAGMKVSDGSWGTAGTAAAGLDVMISRDMPVLRSLGLRVELGYTRASAPALTLRPDRPDDGTLRLPMTEASIGHLDLSGRFVSITCFSQF